MSSKGMGGVCLLSVCWLSGASHLSAQRLELRARCNPSVNNRTSCQIHTHKHNNQADQPSLLTSVQTTCSFSADHRTALWHLANLRRFKRSWCNRHSFHVMTDKVILDYMLKNTEERLWLLCETGAAWIWQELLLKWQQMRKHLFDVNDAQQIQPGMEQWCCDIIYSICANGDTEAPE